MGVVSGTHPLGFFIHPILVHECSTGTPLGVCGVKLWSRREEPKRKKSERYKTRDIAIENKESYKWLEPCMSGRDSVLSNAEHITFVMDREGDIMEVYDRLPNERTDVLVRAMHNRYILTPEQKQGKLYDYVSKKPVCSEGVVKIQGRKRKKRNAEVVIKYANCKLQWQKKQKVNYKNHPEGVEVTIIEVKEKTHKGYKDEPPLIWRLITTKEIKNGQEAKEEIRIYAQRWRIEEYFKLLKSDGYNIESTELESGKSIRKLTLIIMKVSIKVQRLKAARNGTTEIQVEDVFNKDEIKCLEIINEDLSGQTTKQKNPYEPLNLAWATWIIARLGGWKEFYTDKRPPGNKTIIWGMDKFDGIMMGYLISKKKDVS